MSNNQTAEQISAALDAAGKESLTPAQLRHQAEDLRRTADVLEEQLEQQRRRNDEAAAGPTNAVSKARQPSRMKTVRKVLGWTLGVGCVGLVGAYAYSKLRDLGADDVVDAIGNAADTVANKVDAAAAAAAAA